MKGTVKWFNETKGYGFIQPEDRTKDVFVHLSNLRKAHIDTLEPSEKVEFDVLPGKKGNEAVNLKILPL